MGPDRAASRFALRSVARGALITAASLALMTVVIISSYTAASAAGADLSSFASNPAVRALYGVPYDISTAGGFTVWRSGQWIALFAALWVVLATTRILRGDEEAGRWDLQLAAVLTRQRLTVLDLGAMGVATLVVAAVETLAFVAAGEPLAGGALLFGLGVGLLTLDFAAVAAVSSQLFGQRRRAAGVAGAALGAAFVGRMLADATPRLSWLHWLTPFGWLEELRPFAGARALPLLPLAVAPVALGGLALVLVGRRDVGEGVVRDPGTGRSHPALLRSPLRFSWRQRRGGLLAWGSGVVVFGVVVGGITGVVVDFFTENPSLQQSLAQRGLESFASAGGFVASMDTFAALLLAFYVVSSVHMLQEDEEHGRLDLVYADPVTRPGWLQPTVAVSGLLALALGVMGAVAIWLGTVLGSTSVSLADSLVGMANVLPVAALTLGLAVLVYGLRPGWVVAVTGGWVVVTFLMSFLGTALHLPDWALDLSPFHHLSFAPAEPVAWTATIAMVVIAAALVGAGAVAYARRDLQ